MAQLTYREAAKAVHRSILTIKRWRRRGYLPMGWGTRDGQHVRLVDEAALFECLRERLKSDPIHQQKMRILMKEIPDERYRKKRHAD